LAPSTAALDRVLERLTSHPMLFPVRCLDPEENAVALPQAIARLTLAQRLCNYQATTLPAARAARDLANQALTAQLAEQACWTQLANLVEDLEQISERLQYLTDERAGIALQVERGEQVSTAFRQRWEACTQCRQDVLDRLVAQLAGLQAELETVVNKR